MFNVSLYCECLMLQSWIFNVAKLEVVGGAVGECLMSSTVSASGIHSFHLSAAARIKLELNLQLSKAGLRNEG